MQAAFQGDMTHPGRVGAATDSHESREGTSVAAHRPRFQEIADAGSDRAVRCALDELDRHGWAALEDGLSMLTATQSARVMNLVAYSEQPPAGKRRLLARVANHVSPKNLSAMGPRLSDAAAAFALLGASEPMLLDKLVNHLSRDRIHAAFQATGIGMTQDHVQILSDDPQGPPSPREQLGQLLERMTGDGVGLDARNRVLEIGTGLLKHRCALATKGQFPAGLEPVLRGLEHILLSDPYRLIQNALHGSDAPSGHELGYLKWLQAMMLDAGHQSALADIILAFSEGARDDIPDGSPDKQEMRARNRMVSAAASFFGALSAACELPGRHAAGHYKRAATRMMDVISCRMGLPFKDVRALGIALFLQRSGYIVDEPFARSLDNAGSDPEIEALLACVLRQEDWPALRLHMSVFARTGGNP